MFFKKKIPNIKSIDKTRENVLKRSQYLKELILQCEWENKCQTNITGLEYTCMYYTLDFYRQVMSVKYSNFFIECTIRTIFINIEDNLRNTGNQFEKNYFLNMYLKLSKTIANLYTIAQQQHEDEFNLVAMYLLYDECQMTDEEIEQNKLQVSKIANFFKDIINIDEKEL